MLVKGRVLLCRTGWLISSTFQWEAEMTKTSFLTTRENSSLSLCILVLSAGEIVVPVRPDVILGTLSCGVDNREPWGASNCTLCHFRST